MKRNLLVSCALTLVVGTVGFPSQLIASDLLSQEATAEESQTLEQVSAYVNSWRLNEAIALLEGVASEGSQLPAVYQKLGDLYVQAGRSSREAAASYNKALELAIAAENIEAQADAQVAIANLLVANGYTTEATALFNQAKANYETAGNAPQVTEVEEQLSAIASEGDRSSLPVMRGGNQNLLDELVNPEFIGCINPVRCQ